MKADAERLAKAEDLLRQWLTRLRAADFCIPNQGPERDRCIALMDLTRQFLKLRPADDPAAEARR